MLLNFLKKKVRFNIQSCFLLLIIFSIIASCNYNNSNLKAKHYSPSFQNDSGNQKKVVLVGILPLHNPQLLKVEYGPIMDYLNDNIPEVEFQLVVSQSFQEFEKRLDSGTFHMAVPNPAQAINAIKKNYTIFCKMGDDENFAGKILIRKNSGINKLSDLKGKTVCFPAATALATAMMPLYYMQTHGLDVNNDIKRIYSGSQESCILNVYLGVSSASTTWSIPWEVFKKTNPEKASQLEVKWETPSLPNNPLIFRNDVDQKLVQKISSCLIDMPKSEKGRTILKTIFLSKFESANNDTYKPVEDFIKKYNEVIH